MSGKAAARRQGQAGPGKGRQRQAGEPGRVPGRVRTSQGQQGARSRKWRRYSLEDFQAAVAEVQAGASSRATAAKYGIPRSTLLDNKGKERLRAPHPNSALTEEEEAALVGYALWMASHGFPLTRTLIKAFATQIIKASGRETLVNLQRGISEAWWGRFRARHPELSMRQADTLDRARVHGATPETLSHFFGLLEPLYERLGLGDKPHLIFNCDETGFGNIPRPREKVLCQKGQKHIYRQQHHSREHITVHCCVSAAGVSIPPFIIYPRCLPSSAYAMVGPPDALYGVSEKGYMDGGLFMKWLLHFIKHAPVERPLILFVDQHETHVSMEVISLCRENSIELVCLPAHTSHILQPLDVAVFAPLKRQFDVVAGNAGIVRGDVVVGKAKFSEVLKYAYPKAATSENIKAGFRKAGLFPLDREAIMRSDQVVRDPAHQTPLDPAPGASGTLAPMPTTSGSPATASDAPHPPPSAAPASWLQQPSAPPTTLSPAPPFTTTSPAPPSAATSPAPPSATTSPAPPSAATSPAPPSATTSPAPPSATTSPAPPSATTSPAPPSATTSPAPPSATTSPAPPYAATWPLPPSATTSPAPPSASTSVSLPAPAATPAPPAYGVPPSEAHHIPGAPAHTPCPTCGLVPYVNPLVGRGIVPAGLATTLAPPQFGPRQGTNKRRRLLSLGRVATSDQIHEELRQQEENEREKERKREEKREEMQRKREEKRERQTEMEKRREEKRREMERRKEEKERRREERKRKSERERPPTEEAGGHCASCQQTVAPAGVDEDAEEDNWVQCELCTLWFHWICVGLQEEPEGAWLCHGCQH